MSAIILDDELRAKLNDLTRSVEVRDPAGQTVGRFLPQAEYERLLYALAKAEGRTPDADARRAESLTDFREGRAHTTPNAIERLKALIAEGEKRP